MKRILCGCLGMLLVASVALAARIEAEPGKEYPINKEAGAWLICAASYRGQQAKSLALELCFEIRQRYNLPAYVFNRGGDERKIQEQKVNELWKLSPDARVRITRIEEQWAVLVGGYKDNDAARNALEDFKKLKAPEKFCQKGIFQEEGKSDKGEKGFWEKEVVVSPFLTAFVVRNPLAPPEQAKDQNEYPFLKKLNSGESLSLLNNNKPWTLAVKVFGGPTMIQERSANSSKFMDMIGLGGKARDQLDAAALQAHALADALRKMKPSFEAYVLHTRHSSVVTIGGYESTNDPKMAQDQQLLGKLKLQGGTDPGLLQLFPQPLPMEVPKP